MAKDRPYKNLSDAELRELADKGTLDQLHESVDEALTRADERDNK